MYQVWQMGRTEGK